MARRTRTWAVAKAKAQRSALIDHALAHGLQTITRSGRRGVVVSSPLRGARLRIKRSKAKAHETTL